MEEPDATLCPQQPVASSSSSSSSSCIVSQIIAPCYAHRDVIVAGVGRALRTDRQVHGLQRLEGLRVHKRDLVILGAECDGALVDPGLRYAARHATSCFRPGARPRGHVCSNPHASDMHSSVDVLMTLGCCIRMIAFTFTHAGEGLVERFQHFDIELLFL